MEYTRLFPGRFLKAADLEKDVTLTIKGVRTEDIEEKTKAIMSFEGTKKELCLNRTNAEAIVLCLGKRTEDWLQKKITFYAATIKDPFGDGEIGAIRVRGSPHISKPMQAVVQRGRKTIRVSVVPTGQAKNGKPAEAPPHNPETGEVIESKPEPGL